MDNIESLITYSAFTIARKVEFHLPPIRLNMALGIATGIGTTARGLNANQVPFSEGVVPYCTPPSLAVVTNLLPNDETMIGISTLVSLTLFLVIIIFPYI